MGIKIKNGHINVKCYKANLKVSNRELYYKIIPLKLECLEGQGKTNKTNQTMKLVSRYNELRMNKIKTR